MNYLLDTNILIYYFNASLPSNAKTMVSEYLRSSFNISVISKMEFLGFNQFTTKEREKARNFLSFSNILSLDDSIIEQVIKIKQKKKIKLPDAIIAATALHHNMGILTHNTKDFTDIKITILDPFLNSEL